MNNNYMGSIAIRKCDRNYQIIFYLYLIVSLILYWAAPKVMSMNYIRFIGALYLIELLTYFRVNPKQSYLEFDTIFLLFFSIASLAYPLFIYDPDMPFVPFFGLEFNTDSIPKAITCSFVALSAYICGSSQYKHVSKGNASKIIRTKTLSYIIVFLSVAFFLSGGLSYLKALYMLGDVKLSSYGLLFQIESLLTSFIII